MKRAKITIQWKEGLHLRPAARVVKCAQSFSSSISLKVNERMADARSIFGILLLSATLGVAVELEASGPDEDAAIASITSVFEMGENDDAEITRKNSKKKMYEVASRRTKPTEFVKPITADQSKIEFPENLNRHRTP